MMSMFSPFDAFSAESSGWKLFNFCQRTPSPSTSSSASQFDRNSSAPLSAASTVGRDHVSSLRRETATPLKRDTENSSKIDGPSGQQATMTKKKRNPRFAVEFDGVHCFETIVPY